MTTSGAPPGMRSGPEEVATSHQGRSNADQPASTTTSASVQLVPGVCYEPAGRRHRWLCVVEVCPFCQHTHAHYGTRTAPPNGVRTTACGKTYRVYAVYGGTSDATAVTA